jgi:hypothetical protein
VTNETSQNRSSCSEISIALGIAIIHPATVLSVMPLPWVKPQLISPTSRRFAL